MTHQIRKLGAADFEALLALRLRAPDEATLGTKSEQEHSRSPTQLQEDLGALGDTYGYFDNKALVGACTIIIRPTIPGEREGLLRGLLVDADRRRQRFGRKLVARCLEHGIAQLVEEFVLNIRCPSESPRTSARRTYELFRFEVQGVATGTPGSGEDEYQVFRMKVLRVVAEPRLLELRKACQL